MSAKLSSSLPKGEGNGLEALSANLVSAPETLHVVVALVDCSKITTDVDSGDVVPTARVRRIEAIKDPEDGHRLRQLLRRQYERRTGRAVLPIEMEDDISKALGDEPPTRPGGN